MSRSCDPDWDGVQAWNSPNAVSERLQQENARLRTALAEAEREKAALRRTALYWENIAAEAERDNIRAMSEVHRLEARAERTEKSK